jgi:hypothetical protein
MTGTEPGHGIPREEIPWNVARPGTRRHNDGPYA